MGQAANIDQVRNGNPTDPANPNAWAWVNGNVNASQAHMVEDYSVPYRIVMTGLPTNGTVVTLEIQYDTKHSGAHALDFMTGYDNLENDFHSEIWGHTKEIIDPLRDVAGLVPGDARYIPIRTPNTAASTFFTNFLTRKNASTSPVFAHSGEMTIYGATPTNNPSSSYGFDYVVEESLALSIAVTRIKVSFIPTNATAVIAWGGHIARMQDWGAGNSAGGISGSPYHTAVWNWNLNNLGNQDRSLQAAAVIQDWHCDFTVGALNCSSGQVVTASTSVTNPA
jgi:hypothetical protein